MGAHGTRALPLGHGRASTHDSWAGPSSLPQKGLLQRPRCHSNSQIGSPGTLWARSAGPGPAGPGGPWEPGEEVGKWSDSWLGLQAAWERTAGRGRQNCEPAVHSPSARGRSEARRMSVETPSPSPPLKPSVLRRTTRASRLQGPPSSKAKAAQWHRAGPRAGPLPHHVNGTLTVDATALDLGLLPALSPP